MYIFDGFLDQNYNIKMFTIPLVGSSDQVSWSSSPYMTCPHSSCFQDTEKWSPGKGIL